MKITAIEDLHCDAGWRVWSFLKIVTDQGVIGWSEYNESYGSKGLTAVIRKLADELIGKDPRPVERIVAQLYAMTRQAPGGLIAQAIAAIENALVDVKAKALGISVSEMLGGPVRDRLRLYWSHCGSYRLSQSAAMGLPPVKSLADVTALGRDVKAQGFTSLKTNIFMFDRGAPYMHMPGFARIDGWPDLNPDNRILGAIEAQLAAFREGVGRDVDIHLDLNFNFKTEGYLQVARVVEPFKLLWLEIDSFDPDALATIRRGSRTPIASGESLFGRRQFRPYFDKQAMDAAIIDVPWNGILESMKIASMADSYEVNVAPHNFYGHLSTMMSAHFCAAVANFRIMEIDIDDVPWKDEVVTPAPTIENGHLIMPNRPGWGVEVNEKAVRAHPPKK
jgi:galactonate dehydratase